jgi:hypothetical protein
MIFNVDNIPLAVVRFIPVQPVSHSIHTLKNKQYTCSAFNDKTPCPICDMRNAFFKDAQNATTEKSRRNYSEFTRALRPIKKHFIAIIDRAQPEKGVQILVASQCLYKNILKGWITHPCPPHKPKWWQLTTRLKRWRTGYKPPTSALDELQGLDFIIRQTMKNTGSHIFATYEDSAYAKFCSPISEDPAQITAWKEEAKEKLKAIKIPPPSTEFLSIHTNQSKGTAKDD